MAWDPRRSSSRHSDEDDFEDDYPSSYSRPSRPPGTLAQGLINTGNTCFMNSVVQSLASVESFHLYVYTLLEKESGVSDSEKRSRKPVTVLLKQTLKDLTVPTHRPLVPAISTIPALKTRFLTGQQQDAHEFMSYLLDILETEELAPPPLPPQQQASNQQPLSASRSADGRPLRRSASSRGAPPPRNSLSGSPNSAMALLPRKPSRRQSDVGTKDPRPRPAGLVGALKVLSPNRASPGSANPLSASMPLSPIYINGSRTPVSLSASVSTTPGGGYVGVVSLYSPSAPAPVVVAPVASERPIVAPSPMSKKLETAAALTNGTPNHVHEPEVSHQEHSEPVVKPSEATVATAANGHAENGHGKDSVPNGLANGIANGTSDSSSESDQESNADGTVDSSPPTAGLSDDGEALPVKKEPPTIVETLVNGTTEENHSEHKGQNGHTGNTDTAIAGAELLTPARPISPSGLSASVPVTPVARPLTPPSFVTPPHDARFDRYIQERKKRFASDAVVFRMRNPLAGLMESTLFCETCHRSSSTVQKILDLSLYTPATPNPNNPTGNYSIEDCLAQFSQDEEVQGVWCEGCKTKRTMKKRLTIARAPEVLCIHLHRIHNVAQGAAVLKKTSTMVRFARKLNLAPYSSAAAGSFSKSGQTDLGLSPFTDTPSISPARTPRSGRSSAASSRPASRSASRTRDASSSGIRPSHSRGDLTEAERGRKPASTDSSSQQSLSTSSSSITASPSSSMLTWLLSMFTRAHDPAVKTPPPSRPSSRAPSPGPRGDNDSDDEEGDAEEKAKDDETEKRSDNAASDSESASSSAASSATSSRATSPASRGSSIIDTQPRFSHLGWRNATGLPKLDSKTGIVVPHPSSNPSDILSASLGRALVPIDETDYEYELEAVIVHLGDAGGGHYVMYRRLQPNLVFGSQTDYELSMRRKLETINVTPGTSLRQWLYISDHQVSLVDEKVVFGQEAYMLFYQKVQKAPLTASSYVMPPHR